MRKLFLLIVILFLPLASPAHVNSPDVYFDGHAGPYHLLVTIRPPTVVPGVAQIQVRSADSDVAKIEILPLKMLGAASKLAPTADVAARSAADPQLFTGQLWIMTRGSWKVQIAVQGSRGGGELSVPLPAVSSNTAGMQKTLGALLAVLGLLLVSGIVGIVGAAGREASLAPGEQPDAAGRKRGYLREGVATVLVVAALAFGNRWWNAEARANARLNYKQPHVEAELQQGNMLRLRLENPNEMPRSIFGTEPPDRIVLTDLIPDHGHLVHLFLVRVPDLKSFWHLHPRQLDDGQFAVDLPSMPAGRYQIYADIVHQTGFPETEIGQIDLPAVAGQPLSGDDSGMAGANASKDVAELSGGYRMVWDRKGVTLKASQPLWFRFRILDKDGHPATDMENYMGMAGHAVFLSDDGRVFAHVHPAGSVSMAAVSIAEGSSSSSDMAGMAAMLHSSEGPEVSFPYGFPQPGDYHIFVQVKRAGTIETGVFAVHVE